MTTENHILYGGPDVPLVHGDAKCLGEMIQRQFNANALKICFVGEAHRFGFIAVEFRLLIETHFYR